MTTTTKKPHPSKGKQFLDPATMTEIPGFDGKYIMSKGGTIYTREQVVVNKKGVERVIPSKTIKHKKGKYGDPVVNLTRNGKSSTFAVKTLKQITFEGVSLEEIVEQKAEYAEFKKDLERQNGFENAMRIAEEYNFDIDAIDKRQTWELEHINPSKMDKYNKVFVLYMQALRISKFLRDNGRVPESYEELQ